MLSLNFMGFAGPKIRKDKLVDLVYSLFGKERRDPNHDFADLVHNAKLLYEVGRNEIPLNNKENIAIQVYDDSSSGRKYKIISILVMDKEKSYAREVLRYNDEFFDQPSTWKYVPGEWTDKLKLQ